VDDAADDGGVAGELALPEGVTEEDGGAASVAAFFGIEEAAEGGFDAEGGEEVFGDGYADDGAPRAQRAEEGPMCVTA
jgi:hypothetical protein